MRRFFLFLILVLSVASGVVAQGRDAIKTSTDVLMFLPGAVGAGVALYEGDYKGMLQLVETGATSVAAAYILKYCVDKRRPDGSDNMSFPSNHAGVAFAGAAFLQRRYGWKWGAPAYTVAAYVGWGRIYAKRHDVWDVLAGAAIGVGSACLFTTPFARNHNLSVAPFALPDGGGGVSFSMSL
ncbi:MAG: phosphatase PAP2 family protein [Bacteroidaceae bacterium]|nr:phosphatase PAP2 family protein [Bacteroidaceae bacterium]